ncbi:CdaR family protein [Kitasatospora azatica]|uniref:hypothetical protein n=1 Tax=Kitasatospora azatica TaxID=58347 RepID=UPI0005647C6A|nr:hypothetical protein [Kitasatospora azatica]
MREVEDILRVACALKRRSGVYQLDDVAVEFAVASSPEVSWHLARLIKPVVTRPELLETLEALIASDLTQPRPRRQRAEPIRQDRRQRAEPIRQDRRQRAEPIRQDIGSAAGE